VYAAFLQAIRSLPKDEPLRERYYLACVDRAIRHGKMNAVIWNEVLIHCESKKLWGRYLYDYRDDIAKMSPGEASRVLVNVTPHRWSEHAEHRD